MKDRRRLRIKQQVKALTIKHRNNCFLTVIIRGTECNDVGYKPLYFMGEDSYFSRLEIIHKDDFDYYKDKYGDKLEVMF